MKALLTLFVLVLAVLTAGCGKQAAGDWGEGKSPPRTNQAGPVPGRWALADDATAQRVASAGTAYLQGPASRLRNVQFINVAKPIPTTRNGQPAEAVYVQFRAVNNYAEQSLHQRELLIVQGDQVLDHYRTPEEIKNRMTDAWYKKNPPPDWPAIERE